MIEISSWKLLINRNTKKLNAFVGAQADNLIEPKLPAKSTDKSKLKNFTSHARAGRYTTRGFKECDVEGQILNPAPSPSRG